MTLPPLPLIDGCLLIDNSGFMEGICACSRYLQYKTINLRVSGEEHHALNFGTAVHSMLEHRYSVYGNRQVDAEYYNQVSTILTKFFSEHPFPDGDWRDINFAMDMIKQYNARYADEDFDLLVGNDGKPLVEMSFALPLYTAKTPNNQGYPQEIPVIYTGRIDLPQSINGSIYVMDHKTTSKGGQPFWDEQRMTAQHRGYCWAFQELTGKPVMGYHVNMFRTKEIPNYVLANKTFTVTSGKNKGQKRTVDDFWHDTFQRERFLLKPQELDEWKFNTIELVEEFFWRYSRGYFPLKTKWCSVYGRCPYYDICRLPVEDRDSMLNSGAFVKNDWSPLKLEKVKL